ncbi:MAG: selenocysteine-specific translation elongation factor [Candidatus Electrothrix aestuarii]|uniref:Selenocysteine-specific elongation factor n=1 Tax=Candidatus Electrothrix aestuarii TaxID=3062594 RepID=A0AAU8LRX9_9BACT|nr:selenocysteine-specific translation elongation factor [Candidatus Electrothrix aestuarii]
MREIILGTAGHVDHGKTSLIRALTGIETDRLKEEKKRGITIELGFAYIDLACGHRLGIVDVPGHEKFVRNMVAGAAGMDMVAFIVAADEGIMPQTREHFDICKLLGVKDGLIVLTKKDMVEEEWLEMVQEEVREFFADSFLEDAPILPVSSITGEGIEDVKKVLDEKVRKIKFQEEFGPFRLAVDRVFSMKGFGTVITGSSLSGRIAVGEDLMFYPDRLTAKIRGIQVHGKEQEIVEAGHRTAINLQGIEKEEINRGDLAATPGTMQASTLLDADFHYLAHNEKKMKNRTQVRLHVGTREILARVVLTDKDIVEPGEDADIQLILQEPVAVWPGDRFVLRNYSPVMTLGGGVILNSAPPKRKRSTERDQARNREIFSIYKADSGGDGLIDKMLLFLEESGVQGITADQLSTRLGIFGKKLKKQLQVPISAKKVLVVESESQRLVAAQVVDRLSQTVLNLLEQYHRENPLKTGLVREEVRSRLRPSVDQKLFQYLMTSLAKSELIVQEGAEVRLSSHEVTLQVDEQEMQEKIGRLYKDAGLRPPNLRDVLASFADFPEKQIRQVIDLLLQKGTLVKINEALFFHAEELNFLAGSLQDYLKKNGEIDAPGFKDLTGLTRKFSIPLLEYFDKIKLTIRVGDKRILRKSAG